MAQEEAVKGEHGMKKSPLFLSLFLCAAVSALSCRRSDTETSVGARSDETAAVSSVEPAKSSLKKSFFLKHNFGSVREGEILPCRLELENDTEEPIRFKHSRVSCGACVSVKSIPAEIPPGEKGCFELEFDTSGRKGETKQQALFWDAEPKTVLAMADLSAVVQACWAEPDSISLGSLSASEAHESRVTVWTAAFPDASVLSVQTNVPWLKAGPLSEETADDRMVRPVGSFNLKWDGGGIEPGELGGEAEIKIGLGNGDEQTLVLPVHGYLAGDVEILPPSIVFGNVGSERVVRTCRLSFGKGDIDVSGMTCVAEHSAVKISLNPVRGESGVVELTAVWDHAAESSGLAEGVIEGRDASRTPIFKIPYTAYTGTL